MPPGFPAHRSLDLDWVLLHLAPETSEDGAWSCRRPFGACLSASPGLALRRLSQLPNCLPADSPLSWNSRPAEHGWRGWPWTRGRGLERATYDSRIAATPDASSA
ncbi:hypothetical protein FDECE_14600 [Fusarium decemcellulare]|nr:hypothetical protein FDECE_14600 [Fusarium decemcellulare]